MRVLDFFEAVQGSSSIEEMASAFIHLFPSPSIQDDLMQVEVRLALVFSKLNRAAIFVPSSSSSRPLSINGSKSSFRDSTTVNQSTLVSSMISSGFSASGSFNMYRHGSLKSGTVLSLDYTISEEGDDEKEEELPAGTNPSDSSSTNGVEQEPSFSRSSKMRASLSPSSSKRSSLSKRLPNDSSSLSLLPSQSGLGPPAGPSSRKHRSVVTLAGALSAGYIQIGDGANGPEAGDPRGSSGGSQRKDDRTSTSRNTKDRSSYISWRSSHAEASRWSRGLRSRPMGR